MDQQVTQEFIRQIVAAVINGLILAASIFGMLILKRLAAKYGLQVDAIQEARLKATVQDILIGVEEQVEARAKLEGVLNKGYEKMELAVGRVVDAVPGITTNEAEQLVQQELPKVGLGASGFVTEVVKRANAN